MIEHTQPEITVLVIAHNEAAGIEACLRAIADQDYPMERVEIVLVDDRGTDGTTDRARAMGLDSLRIARVDEPHPTLSAWQTAVDLGIREAKGEIVLITDADSRVPREWIRELTGHLSYRDGAVTTPVIMAGRPHLLAGVQTVDALINFTLYRWAHRNGWATGVVGASLAIWREAYLTTGGFPVLGFSLNGPVALAQGLTRTGYSLRYLTEPAVQKGARERFIDELSRLRRLALGHTPMLTILVWLVVSSNLLLAAAACAWGGFWLVGLIARYGLGLLLITTSLQQYRNYPSLNWVWAYEPALTLAMPLLYLSNLVAPRWVWGGISYDRKGPEQPAEAARPAG